MSLLRRAPLAQTRLPTFQWNAYYNAVPFEKDGHFLWLPVLQHESLLALPHMRQELSIGIIRDLVALAEQSPNMIVFFNTLHAGATVNHCHAQAVTKKRNYAIEDAETSEYKGCEILRDYPAEGIVFGSNTDPRDLFFLVDLLQRENTPFNLVMLRGRNILVPRNVDHEVVSEFPGGVLATMELCGGLITVDVDAYTQIDMDRIKSAFAKTVLPVRPVIDRWRDVQRWGYQ